MRSMLRTQNRQTPRQNDKATTTDDGMQVFYVASTAKYRNTAEHVTITT